MKFKVFGGAGAVGSAVVKDLLRNPAATQVVIADIDEQAANSRLHEIGDKRVSIEFLDATSAESINKVVDRNYVIANTIGPNYIFCQRLARAAAEAGAKWADICDDYDAAEAMFELDDLAREKGTTLLTCMGTSPGVTNILAKKGAEMLDRAEHVHTYWAVGGDDPVGPSELYHLAHICTDEIPQFLDGEWKKVAAFTDPVPVEFPEPVGVIPLPYIGHSEPVTIPRFIKGLKSVTNRGGLLPVSLNDLVSMVKSLGFFANYEMEVKGVKLTPRDCGVAHFNHILNTFPELLGLGGGSEEGSISVFRVEIKGEKDGAPMEVVYTGTNEVIDSTSRSLSIAAQMLASGEIDHKGVIAPEGCIPTDKFLDLMKDGGGITLNEEIKRGRKVL